MLQNTLYKIKTPQSQRGCGVLFYLLFGGYFESACLPVGNSALFSIKLVAIAFNDTEGLKKGVECHASDKDNDEQT